MQQPPYPMTATDRTRYCVSCGRSIPWDANVCPFCGRDYRYPGQPPARPQEKYSGALRAVLYILSFLIWIVGIVIGLVFYTRGDEESMHVGKICLILGILGLVLGWGLAALLYVIVVGFGTA